MDELIKLFEENDRIGVREISEMIGVSGHEEISKISVALSKFGWIRFQARVDKDRKWFYKKPIDLDICDCATYIFRLFNDPKLYPRNALRRKAINLTTYSAFCCSIGLELSSGQQDICQCVYDGNDAKGGPIFGGYEGAIPTLARQIVVAVCGRRGGKTRTLLALRVLYGALVRDLTGLGKGEEAFALIVAPRLPAAKQSLRYISGEINANPYLSSLLERESSESITLRREDGYAVTISIMPATAKGSALRGMSLTDAVFDESAFFRDADYKVSDVELFKAVSPCIMMGGQMIIASTPWAKSGLLWDLFSENYGHPKTAIAVHAPTLTLRDDPKLAMLVELERQRDPDNARREYDAEFLSAGAGNYFDADRIDQSIDNVIDDTYNPQYVYAAGADFGFVNDSSALVIVSFDGRYYRTVRVIELRPDEGALKPSEVVSYFASILKSYGISHVVSDIHYREAIREMLQEYKIDLIASPDGQKGKIESFARAKSMLNENRIRLSSLPKFIRQLKDVRSRTTSGGGLIIDLPRKQGGHGDIVSAWVLAMWRLTWMTIHDVQYRDWFRFGAKYKAPDYEKEMAMLEKYDMERYGGKRKEDW